MQMMLLMKLEWLLGKVWFHSKSTVPPLKTTMNSNDYNVFVNEVRVVNQVKIPHMMPLLFVLLTVCGYSEVATFNF